MTEPHSEEYYLRQDRKPMTEPARQFLDGWVAEMDSVLMHWRERYLTGLFPFDFSLDSLDVLETVLLSRYAQPSEFEADTGSPFIEGAVRYYGETLRRNLPCRWGYQDLGDEASDDLNRVPEIRSNTPLGYMRSVVPLRTIEYLVTDGVTGVLKRRMSVILRAIRDAESDADDLG